MQGDGGAAFGIKLQGSNDAAASIDLYSSPGGVLPNAGSLLDIASGIDISTAYRCHRLNFNCNNASSISIAEVTFYEKSGPNSLGVRSSSFTAASALGKIKALLSVTEEDAVVAGADYTLEFSCDGDATWTAAALTELYTMPTTGMRMVETNEVDVSAQPSGTSPRWRFKTFNSKMVELDAAGIYWSGSMASFCGRL